MEWKHFTFIGLGLIGGSLAKAIKKAYPDSHISVLDKDEHSIQIALAEAVVNQELKKPERNRKRYGSPLLMCSCRAEPSLFKGT